jgi:hypothetical protein
VDVTALVAVGLLKNEREHVKCSATARSIGRSRSPLTASRPALDRRSKRPVGAAMPSNTIQALLNAFKIPDLRQKLLYTLGLLVVSGSSRTSPCRG